MALKVKEQELNYMMETQSVWPDLWVGKENVGMRGMSMKVFRVGCNGYLFFPMSPTAVEHFAHASYMDRCSMHWQSWSANKRNRHVFSMQIWNRTINIL